MRARVEIVSTLPGLIGAKGIQNTGLTMPDDFLD